MNAGVVGSGVNADRRFQVGLLVVLRMDVGLMVDSVVDDELHVDHGGNIDDGVHVDWLWCL